MTLVGLSAVIPIPPDLVDDWSGGQADSGHDRDPEQGLNDVGRCRAHAGDPPSPEAGAGGGVTGAAGSSERPIFGGCSANQIAPGTPSSGASGSLPCRRVAPTTATHT